MRRIEVAERRARLGRRHRLAPLSRAGDPVEVARSMLALHSSDAPTVYLAALARMRSGSLDDVSAALYEQRSLVRVMGMRRTVFVVPVELMPVVVAACGEAVAARERSRLLAILAEMADLSDLPDGQDVAGWLEHAEAAALAGLAMRGEARASDLAGDDPRLDTELVLNVGKAYEGRQKVASRVLTVLAAEGRIVRSRPVGSWRSSQYRWCLTEQWITGPQRTWSVAQAQAELARRWLASFGPATVADFRWWSGLPAGAVKKAFAQLDLAEVDLDGLPGVVLAEDLDPVDPTEPWVALLPALDSTPMGWKHREWYLGEHGPRLFDTTGNVGPTIWCDGRIVGGWTQRESGEIALALLEDVGSEAAGAIEAAAGELGAHVGPLRLAPRARGLSQVERQLTR
jgi:hypothetical protein